MIALIKFFRKRFSDFIRYSELGRYILLEKKNYGIRIKLISSFGTKKIKREIIL